jgi:lipopolysaccharide biosynthesis regulator YciM
MTELSDLLADHDELWVALVAVALLSAIGGAVAALFWPGRRRRGLLRRASDERSSYLRGVNYILSNDADGAIEELTKVLQLDTDTVETYFALGALFRTKGEVERAIRIHQNLLGRAGLDEHTHTQALFELGLDFRKAGLYRRAMDTFEEVVRRQPAFVDAYRELQRIYEDTREWEKAYAMQQEVAKRSGHKAAGVLAHLMVEIGGTHEEAGDLRQARQCYRKALAIDSGSVRAHLALGELCLREGNAQEAIGFFQRAMKHNPGLSGLIYPRLHVAYERQGAHARYESFLRQQVVRDESDVFARLALARLVASRGRTREAIDELKRALDHKPDFVEARKALGDLLLASGSVEELRREYDDLLGALVRPMKSYQCRQCGFEAPEMIWKCPQCLRWDTVGFKCFRRERRSRRRVA